MPFPNSGAVNTSAQQGVTPCILATLATQQTTNIAANDHLKLDTVVYSRGKDIALDTTTAYVTTIGAASIGRFTLKAGLTYYMRVNMGYVLFSGATGVVDMQFYDATANAAITTALATVFTAADASQDGATGVTEAVFTPAQDTLMEIRIQAVTALTRFGTTGSRAPTVWIEAL